MGESYFEVVFTQEPQQIKEVYRHSFFRRPMGIVLMSFLGLSGFVNLLIALHTWQKTGFRFADLSMIFNCLFFFGLYYALYRLQIKTTVRRQLELGSGQPLQCRMVFYPDVVHIDDSNGTHVSLPYGNVQWSTTTKNLFLFRTKARLLYFFPKAAFIKGQPEYFLSFLVSRGVKVK